MKSAIASQFLSRTTRRANRRPVSPAAWQWPSPHGGTPVSPDTRLLCPELPDVTARMYFSDESVIVADVRAVTAHDLVVRLPEQHADCIQGQAIDVTVMQGNRILVDTEQSILHWVGNVNHRPIGAMFTLHATKADIVERFSHGCRGDVRYPVELPATILTPDNRGVPAQIADYSLNGCRIICDESFVLDCEYEVNVRIGHSDMQVAVRPRWAMKCATGYQMGCTFRSDEGVLFAGRHRNRSTQPEGLKGPVSRRW